jgi:hypothetical protein
MCGIGQRRLNKRASDARAWHTYLHALAVTLARVLPTAALCLAGITVGLVNTHYAYLPIPEVIAQPRTVDPHGKAWNRLRASIGQPGFKAPAKGARRSRSDAGLHVH